MEDTATEAGVAEGLGDGVDSALWPEFFDFPSDSCPSAACDVDFSAAGDFFCVDTTDFSVSDPAD